MQDQTAGRVTATGTLIFQSEDDPSITGRVPQGYYLESTATGRVYVEAEGLQAFLGQRVQASGKLVTRCGPDGFVCFPAVVQASVVQTP